MTALDQRTADGFEAKLLMPEGCVTHECPEVSIVVPALNESLTVGEFVEWCKEGLKRAGVAGQIMIVDSSTDRTPQIALAHGAEVLRVPKRGLGQAYIDATPFIRGRYILMGDADLTYDFREIAPFVEQFRKGCEFIMGSRFKGTIEKGAMPPLHRYFGTPLTTWILNRIYGSTFSDIHCGMRGVTREAFARIDLQSQSWEYASEMVLKAVRLKLNLTEVPVRFYKDRDGRVSHHRRASILSPWIAGWINLKVMLVYSPDTFLLRPGFVLFLFGTILSLSLVGGPYSIGNVGFNLHWMLLGVTSATLGYSCVQIGLLARILHNLRPVLSSRIKRRWTYNLGVAVAGLLAIAGVALNGTLLWQYLAHGLRLTELSYQGIFGLLLITIGFQTFCFTLLIEMVRRVSSRWGP